MGWIWSDTYPKDGQGITPLPDQEVKAETAATPPVPLSSPNTTPERRTLTRDEQADAELQELLKELRADDHTSDSPSSSPPSVSPPTLDTSPPSQINHSSISPDALYPTSMSCRAAFDSAFYCQSLGGQFTNLYRYGKIRNCSDQWSNFWFCMRTNRGMMSEEARARRIQAHYRERAAKYRTGPSSEDVWEIREERVVDAFEGDLEAVEEEMRREKREREEGWGG